MTTADEWDVKRVADLVVGDEVRDYGVLHSFKDLTQFPWRYLFADGPDGTRAWAFLRESRVDVRRPIEVTVNKASSVSKERTAVFVGSAFVVNMPCQEHAEWYAERLRGSADERRKALGQ